MKKLCFFISCSLIWLSSGSLEAQSILNTTGQSFKGRENTYSYSIGEQLIQTLNNPNGQYYTQGVLQPLAREKCPLRVAITSNYICLGASENALVYTARTYEPDNEFRVQIFADQDANGDTITIGGLKATKADTVPIQIPANLNSSKKYYIRVVSSNPRIIGCPNRIFISAKPEAKFRMDTFACTGDGTWATFTGKGTIRATNYEWYFSDGLILQGAKDSIRGNIWNNPGRKKVKLVVNNAGCKSDTAIQIVRVEKRLEKPKIQCDRITGNSVRFTWSQVGGADSYVVLARDNFVDISNTSNSRTYFNLPASTSIKLVVKAVGSGPCGLNIDSATCKTLDCPNFTASLADLDASTCGGAAVAADLTLAGASRAGEYLLAYQAGGGSKDTLSLQPGIKPLFNPEVLTTYSFLGIGHQGYPGCFTAINLPFTVIVIPNGKPGKPQDTTLLVCDNQFNPIVLNTLLEGEDSGGDWFSLQGLNLDAFDPIAGTFTPEARKPGFYEFLYRVSGRNACQDRSASVFIQVEKKLEVAIKDYSNCLDLNGKTVIDLNTVARRVNTFAPNRVAWYRDQNLKDSIKIKTFEISAPTTVFAVVGRGKCASAVVGVTLKPGEILPVPKLEGLFQYKVGEIINLRTTSSFPPGSVFTWRAPDTLVSGTDIYQFPARLVTKFSEGRYTLEVRGPQEPGKPSCESPTAWSEVEVFDVDEPALSIGKSVSENKPWKIVGLEAFPKHRIAVYNRWGERVFYIEGAYGNNWTGTFNGKKLPQGAYYYQIDTGELGQKVILGDLSVIR